MCDTCVTHSGWLVEENPNGQNERLVGSFLKEGERQN